MNPPDVPDDIECLIVDEKMVKNGIHSFANGSATGIDGLLPQHLKDLIATNNGEATEKLLIAYYKNMQSHVIGRGERTDNRLSMAPIYVH